MREEYDLSEGERRKFYGKVDARNPIVEAGEKDTTEVLEDAEFSEIVVHENKCSN